MAYEGTLAPVLAAVLELLVFIGPTQLPYHSHEV